MSAVVRMLSSSRAGSLRLDARRPRRRRIVWLVRRAPLKREAFSRWRVGPSELCPGPEK